MATLPVAAAAPERGGRGGSKVKGGGGRTGVEARGGPGGGATRSGGRRAHGRREGVGKPEVEPRWLGGGRGGPAAAAGTEIAGK